MTAPTTAPRAVVAQRTFVLPDLGEGLTEAEIVAWSVAEGDTVEIDQGIVEVETAKSVVEVPAPFAGTVVTLHAGPGDVLAVGNPLITVAVEIPDSDGESASAHPDGERYRQEERAGSGHVLVGYGTASGPSGSRRRRRRSVEAAVATDSKSVAPQPDPATAGTAAPVGVISPVVRKLARDNGVDIAAILGTGPNGLITRSDVERFVKRPSLAPAPPFAETPAGTNGAAVAGAPDSRDDHKDVAKRIPLSGFRKAVAARMTFSRQQIPEASVWVDIDATPLWNLRESGRAENRDGTVAGPGLLAYLARFAVAGLKEYPVFNAHFDLERDEIVQYEQINLGIATQGDRGLIVPPVMNAGSMTTAGIDAAIREVTARARVGRVSPAEMDAVTFTLNNYGPLRVDGSAAIINYPQVAILGFGRMIDRPWVVDGSVVARKIVQMSFVFDHRVCDGGTAAGFMRFVADAIENPVSAIASL